MPGHLELIAAAHLSNRRHQTVTDFPNTVVTNSTTHEEQHGHQKSCTRCNQAPR